MYYEAIDKWNNKGPYLEHAKHKYIKKIQIGPYTRYFYTPGQLRAYYNALRKEYNRQDVKDLKITKYDIHEKALNNGLKNFKKKDTRKFSITMVGERQDGKYTDIFGKGAAKEINKESSRLKRAAKMAKEDVNATNSRKAFVETGKFVIRNLFGHRSKDRAIYNATRDYIDSVKNRKRMSKENRNKYKKKYSI